MSWRSRSYRGGLLIKCLWRGLFHGAAIHAPTSITDILVVPTGKLGDAVCNTPVFKALRTHFPRSKIIAAGDVKLLEPLLADSGLVDGYIDLGQSDVIERLKQRSFQAAIITGPSYIAMALCYLAGVPLVVAPRVIGGWSPAVTRPYKVLQKLVATFPYRFGAYAPGERLKALEPLGIKTSDTKKCLGFSVTAATAATQFFSQHGINPEKDMVVGIAPGAGNKIKAWPVERFAAVAEYLVKNYRAKIILIGSPADSELAVTMMGKLAPGIETTNAIGQFNLDILKAVISQLRLFISVDTGPVYIAEAFKIPTVDITGPIDEREQPPIGQFHKVVPPQSRRRPELFVLNAKVYNHVEALRQINSITVTQVTTVIDSLISEVNS